MTRAACLLVALAACAPKGAPPVAPVEVAIGGVGDAGLLHPGQPAPPRPEQRDRCTARLIASKIRTPSNCQLDERLTRGPGTLSYPCSREDGEAEGVFGEHRFVGTISGGTLRLELTTELDWDDGCHWETRQGIRGDLREGKDAKLTWTYSERPVTGAQCAGSCKAQADIAIELDDEDISVH